MKQRRLFALLVIGAALLSKPALSFAQTQTYTWNEVAGDLSDFSKDMRGALAFISLTGLSWSDTYIGQLINIRPHWGVGFNVGATTLKLDNLNTLLKKFGYTSDDSFMDKQLLPVYTIDLRIGGFGSVPFDVGIKWGYLPYMKLFNDISYEVSVSGLDFRWEILDDWGSTPSIAIGLEASSVSGGLRSDGKATLTGLSNFGNVTIGRNATAGVIWEGFVFGLKLQAAKSFWEPHLNSYAGLRVGGAVTKTGYQLSGGKDIIIDVGSGTLTALKDMSGSALGNLAKALESASKHNTDFLVNEDTIVGLIERSGANFSLYTGIAFDFSNRTYFDIAIMVDILNSEVGANVSFRYQQ
ncbi:MAG: hypothetical protein LBJ35_01115 [Spirochaetaceae bacterium]|jgi:hypothetical protein|nr:hypothetical protein [Spirochaetaceae bacterium]